MQYILFVSVTTSLSFSQNKIADSLPDRLAWDKKKKNTKELNKLLTNPLDLKAFKKANPGRSNSDGAPKYDYLYKPEYAGFYYRYLYFPKHRDKGPRITTYKKGKEIGGYMDTSEVFIALTSDRPDETLGKANLLADTDEQLLKKFGDNYIKQDKILIYQYNKTLLIISMGNSRWFKIVRVKKSYKNYDEIKDEKDLLVYK